jgi:excisionase family DNA binding protein
MTTTVVVLTSAELEALVERVVARAREREHPASGAEVMTRAQVAELLHVEPHHVRTLVKRGMPAHRLGTQWRFRRGEVLAWLERQGGK